MTDNAKQPIGKILLLDVRFSYFYGFEPFIAQPTQQNPNPKPVYTLHALMAKTHPQLTEVAEKIAAVATAEWGADAPAMLDAFKQQDKICLHKGDVTKVGKPEYAGLFFVSASNKRPFTIVDVDGAPLFPKDGRPYSGCYGNAMIEIWAQNNNFGKRINATVTGVQFTRHAAAFGGGPPPARADEFPVNAKTADAPAPATTGAATGASLLD